MVGESGRLRGRARRGAGIHHLPRLVADAEDPLGLVRMRRQLGDPLEITVYPRLAHLYSCALVRRTWARAANTAGAGR